MSFVRSNPAGWAPLEELAAAQMNQVDINQSRAIDGTGGGTYTPGAVILIDGTFGLQVDAPFQANGTFEVNSASAVFTNGVTVDGLAIFTGTLTAAVAQVSGNFTVGGDALIGGELTVNDESVFNADVTIAAGLLAGATILGTLAVPGAATFNGAVTMTDLLTAGAGIVVGAAGVIVNGPSHVVGQASFDDPVILTGDAHIRCRPVAGASSNTNYGVNTVDEVLVSHSVTGINYRILDAGAGEGSRIRFAVIDPTATPQVAIVRDSDGANFGNLGNAPGRFTFMDFTFQGGTWRRTAYYLAA